MTQTVSFKDKFKSGFAIFKWELKSCKHTLIVFSILSSVFIAIALTLAIVAGFSDAVDSRSFNYDSIQTALSVFQTVTSYLIFTLNAVFTIVYTIRIYSYLHNKRKADLYGPMPISRRTFFVAKTISAYILSIIPTLFFLGIIAIISVLFGQPVVPEVASLYVKLLLGAIACISFYALLAVCCGTTLNSVLSFIAINFAYPVTALFIKGTIKAFFIGMPTTQYSSSFIMKALNPLSAYDGTNIIYWLFFTALCLFLGIWLVKKRKAECAQTSFAYHLPCYIVELLVSFIIGMFLGTLFGTLNVLLYGLAGFVFGFVLGSVPAYIITHLILYKGFNRILKSAIPYGAMVVTVVALITFCNFDVFGYNSFVPSAGDVKSAGLVDLGNCYCAGEKGAFGLANMASDDYEDSENIENVITFHKSAVKLAKKESSEKFGSIWSNLLLSNIPSEYMDGYCVSYRLKSGRISYRYYDPSLSGGIFSSNVGDFDLDAADKIIFSDEYYINYSEIMNVDIDSIQTFEFSYHYANNDVEFDSYNNIKIEASDDVDAKTASRDRKLILEAYRKDVKEKGKKPSGDYIGDLCITFGSEELYGDSFFGILESLFDSGYGIPKTATVYKEYTNTINALKEAGILNNDNKLNKDSEYYKNRTITWYDH